MAAKNQIELLKAARDFFAKTKGFDSVLRNVFQTLNYKKNIKYIK